jgi:hypothetical protein
MKPGRIASVMLLILASPACSRAPARTSDVTRRDSAGVAVVVTAREARREEWRLSAAPLLDLANGNSPAHNFQRIRGFTQLRNGDFVVLDGASCQIRYFSEDGEPLRQIGRCGRGAGEYASLWLVGRTGSDALLIWDGERRRFTWIDTEGLVSASIEIADSAPAMTPWEVFADHRVLATLRYAGLNDASNQATQDITVLWDLDPLTLQRQAIVQKPGIVWWTHARGREPVPFTGNAVFALSGDDIVISTGIDHAIERWSRTARLLSRYVDERPAATLSPGEIAAYRDAELRRLDPAAVRGRLAEWDALPLPDHTLAYDRLLAGPAGEVWARDYEWRDDREHHWSVFDSTGTAIARVRTPSFLEILELREDRVLGRGFDASGREHAWVYRLERPGTAASRRPTS